MNRKIIVTLALLSSTGASYAEEQKPVRVIPITREAADASAQALAAAKNPTIGAFVASQPLPQTRISADAPRSDRRERYASRERVREARADAIETPPVERSTRRVEVMSPTRFGTMAVRVYEVRSGY